MAGLAVIPVDQVDRAVRTGLEVDASEPGVVSEQEIVAVLADEPRSLGNEHVGVETVSMDVGHEDPTAPLARESVRLVDHRAAVSMSAPDRGGPTVARVRCGAEVVPVVGDRLDVVVDVRVEVVARLPLVAAPLE